MCFIRHDNSTKFAILQNNNYKCVFHCSNFLCLIYRLRSRVAEEENFRSEDNLHEILSLAVKTTADADLNARNVSGFCVYPSSQSTHVHMLHTIMHHI